MYNYSIKFCVFAVSDHRLTNLMIINLPIKSLIYNWRKQSASIPIISMACAQQAQKYVT